MMDAKAKNRETFRSLSTYAGMLEKSGMLVRVREPVSTHLEMTEIQTRVLAQNGPAILFENPVSESGEPAQMPVLVNLFGTIERVALGLRRSPDQLGELGQLLANLNHPDPVDGLRDAFDKIPLLKSAMAMRPKTVKSGPINEIVLKGEDVDLSTLPIQTCWPGEPAPLITWPLVVTKGPGDGPEDGINVGVYRMQVLGKNRTIMRWLDHRGGANHHKAWAARGEKMPVAVVIGADPGTILAAVTPVPELISEYQFAGLLRGERLALTNCQTVPLQVPAQAEIVLEGYVSPDEVADEGPYGDHTGYYNSIEKFPVFHITAMTRRKNPIYLSTFTGRPPDEPSVIAQALNDVYLPVLQQQFPEVKDYWLPPEACSYRIAVVSIKKLYPGHARRIMMGLWSCLPQFNYTKLIIVVDDDINVRNWQDVIWALSTRMDAARDLMMVDNTPIDYLDFASPRTGLGSKLGIDATIKIGSETSREWGRPIAMDKNVIQTINEKWTDLGLPGSGLPIWSKS